MIVTVLLHTILQIQTPEGPKRRLEVDIPSDSTVLDLIEHLEIEIDPEDLLLAVNGRIAHLDQQLEESDKVHLMLPISGG